MNENKNNPKKPKMPWPTKDTMKQVYELKLWGDNKSAFYSGAGSHESELVDPYIQAVTGFLSSFNNPITVCDLGCGDFNVGEKLVKFTKQYIAVDIVPDLIIHNKETFKADNLEFQCLDIAVDDLPKADCALVRQVLQHLSNSEVQEILNKLKAFKYVIITEHISAETFTPNKDIISGQGIRLKKQSGLDVLVAPFNFKVLEQKLLVSVIVNDGKEIIVTTLYTIF
ncbi:class I SAM-dependent methyltransferase [Bizionia myxarmorum]|uniref:Class I SAM-dependent methyltransferase n=1 Tax=Bizionia myxarmorum TaxID=291186 RepID=A0A5D0R6D7_9FLAO|nr:class I SAM-dependent methyltransferase [Bizionia myxarmorum]TYB76431.1 class I SAM-dependent methyltransferase [Bizionia myxarmorum]